MTDCKGFRVDLSDPTVTGDAQSPEFEFDPPDEPVYRDVQSGASVYETAEEAKLSWKRTGQTGAEALLSTRHTRRGPPRPVRQAPVSARHRSEVRRVAPRRVSFTLVIKVTQPGLTVMGYLDVVLLGRDRMNTLMLYGSTLTPAPPGELNRLTRVMAGRMAKAFPWTGA